MFIREDDVADIKVYFRKKKYSYDAIIESEYNELDDEAKKKYSGMAIKMKILTWAMFNELQDGAMVTLPDGEQKFNYRLYKENRLKKLIKEWDAKDKDGKPIPVNENMIAHLSPAIAETILKAYDEVTFISEEEEGKS